MRFDRERSGRRGGRYPRAATDRLSFRAPAELPRAGIAASGRTPAPIQED
jgi:hypothetical protein